MFRPPEMAAILENLKLMMHFDHKIYFTVFLDPQNIHFATTIYTFLSKLFFKLCVALRSDSENGGHLGKSQVNDTF